MLEAKNEIKNGENGSKNVENINSEGSGDDRLFH